MNFPQLFLGLLMLILACSCRADQTKAPDRGVRAVSDRYETLMTEFITGKEFENVIVGLRVEGEPTDHELRFFVAGFIRAWLEYREYRVLSEGRGLGKVQNLMPGVLRHEMAGWLLGCRTAAAKGKVLEAQAIDELRHILKGK